MCYIWYNILFLLYLKHFHHKMYVTDSSLYTQIYLSLFTVFFFIYKLAVAPHPHIHGCPQEPFQANCPQIRFGSITNRIMMKTYDWLDITEILSNLTTDVRLQISTWTVITFNKLDSFLFVLYISQAVYIMKASPCAWKWTDFMLVWYRTSHRSYDVWCQSWYIICIFTRCFKNLQ